MIVVKFEVMRDIWLSIEMAKEEAVRVGAKVSSYFAVGHGIHKAPACEDPYSPLLYASIFVQDQGISFRFDYQEMLSEHFTDWLKASEAARAAENKVYESAKTAGMVLIPWDFEAPR